MQFQFLIKNKQNSFNYSLRSIFQCLGKIKCSKTLYEYCTAPHNHQCVHKLYYCHKEYELFHNYILQFICIWYIFIVFLECLMLCSLVQPLKVPCIVPFVGLLRVPGMEIQCYCNICVLMKNQFHLRSFFKISKMHSRLNLGLLEMYTDAFHIIRQGQGTQLDNFLQTSVPQMKCLHITQNVTMFFSKLSFQCSSIITKCDYYALRYMLRK